MGLKSVGEHSALKFCTGFRKSLGKVICPPLAPRLSLILSVLLFLRLLTEPHPCLWLSTPCSPLSSIPMPPSARQWVTGNGRASFPRLYSWNGRPHNRSRVRGRNTLNPLGSVWWIFLLGKPAAQNKIFVHRTDHVIMCVRVVYMYVCVCVRSNHPTRQLC